MNVEVPLGPRRIPRAQMRFVLTVVTQKLSCSAPQSALDPLLKRISAHHVVDFECAEAELEGMFMGYYGGETHAGERPHEVTV